jgi:DNA primase
VTGSKAPCVGPPPIANSQRRRIPKELVEAIRGRFPIDQVIGEHVQLRRSGIQLIGRCPFHADKTPSLAVHPGKQVFRCHGCGLSGDVFRFVQLRHDCSFPQSVADLAARAGICIDGFNPSPEQTAAVAAREAQREEEMRFQHFVNERIAAVNQRYRSLARAATNAEDYLRAGLPADAHIDDFAWSALERFRVFEARIEREGLCDLDILHTEWQARRGDQHVAA